MNAGSPYIRFNNVGFGHIVQREIPIYEGIRIG
jgi:hypothetical protein